MHRPFYSYDISITLERISSQVHTILMGMLMGKSYAGASQLEPHVSAFGSSIVETCVVLIFFGWPPWKLETMWKSAENGSCWFSVRTWLDSTMCFVTRKWGQSGYISNTSIRTKSKLAEASDLSWRSRHEHCQAAPEVPKIFDFSSWEFRPQGLSVNLHYCQYQKVQIYPQDGDIKGSIIQIYIFYIYIIFICMIYYSTMGYHEFAPNSEMNLELSNGWLIEGLPDKVITCY